MPDTQQVQNQEQEELKKWFTVELKKLQNREKKIMQQYNEKKRALLEEESSDSSS
ncbi:MAG: hypothetical protein Q8P90_01240 [bacterium]|nr:hypothetical protein [bacterium]